MNEDSNFGNIPSHDHSFSDSHDYLSRAQYAVESGDRILGIHLYLAAFEQSILENIVPSEESVNGMRAAWDLAVDARQHSLAEYIFEKLKPFVSAEELSRKADQLQDVALDRLEEFGFSREAIEDMAEMINDDLFNLPPDLLYRYEDDNVPSPFSFLDLSSKSDSASDESDDAPTAETSDRAEEVKAEPIEPEQKEANPTAEADAARVPSAEPQGCEDRAYRSFWQEKEEEKSARDTLRLFHDPWLLACYRRDEASWRWQDARSAVQGICEDAQLPSWCFAYAAAWHARFLGRCT